MAAFYLACTAGCCKAVKCTQVHLKLAGTQRRRRRSYTVTWNLVKDLLASTVKMSIENIPKHWHSWQQWYLHVFARLLESLRQHGDHIFVVVQKLPNQLTEMSLHVLILNLHTDSTHTLIPSSVGIESTSGKETSGCDQTELHWSINQLNTNGQIIISYQYKIYKIPYNNFCVN